MRRKLATWLGRGVLVGCIVGALVLSSLAQPSVLAPAAAQAQNAGEECAGRRREESFGLRRLGEQYGVNARVRLDGSGSKEVVVEGRWQAVEEAFGKRWLVLRKERWRVCAY